MPVVGLNDLNNNNAKKDEEEEGKRNELYTGGNRRGGGGSGLSVIGPGDDEEEEEEEEKGAKSHVGNMFSRAQANAAEGVSPGSGVPKRVITMYANGFTIDDGPFRSLDDPANKPFLRDVGRGVVPRELEDSAQESGAYHLELVDRRAEHYKAPAYVAFSGGGNTLGTLPSSPAVEPVVSEDQQPKPAPVVIDDAQPKTTLQIRLANGRRIRATLNLSHTVAHLEAYVRAHSDNRPFVLLAGYPPAILADRDATIQSANLQGASITQKCS
ncbi:hypothetical protein CTAYLR_000464 [Chrysophaeum taylorii]|uniref:NSFL1 cofactor p47 n=1 Tax=Chrysophaeum taylorii TaxID=2483200 RepID=A0AAD7UFY2_9STRA|nr:hypothetical protein CTAYLR_000464 [Chrysophaeum taylorii]